MWIRDLFDSLKPTRSRSRLPRKNISATRRQAGSSQLAVEALEERVVPASLWVGDATIIEGNSGTQNVAVTVNLYAPRRHQTVSVKYNTVNGTALAGSDYEARSGKLTFRPGETSKTILVPVKGDRLNESDESFFVKLNHPSGAKIADAWGSVTIVDGGPIISISDASAREDTSGTSLLTFTVNLSGAYDEPVKVDYATQDGSALAGINYVSTAGTLTFEPGQTSQTILVTVNGDRTPGPDKSFSVNVSSPNSYAHVSKSVGVGTIIDAEPRISIGDVWNYGETSFTFSVSLSAAYDQDVTVDFATVDGTALAGVDYIAASGPLTFVSGETTKLITIDVLNPTSVGQYFSVHLSGASTNALVSNEWATGNWYYDYGYYDYGYYDYGYYGYYDYGYYY